MKIKKILLWLIGIAAAAYLVICFFLYYKQESLIFHPKALPKDFQFSFKTKFEERNIKTNDGTELSGVLFIADSSKGLVFYLHGNAGAMDTWGDIAPVYNAMGYDIFILDYRGFGKSGGSISDEEQFYNDIRRAYSEMTKEYAEDKIVIIGYSIGTGPAAMLASENNPKMLVLLAPYYSLIDMMNEDFPYAPAFLLKYKFMTNKFLSRTKSPVFIFHGDGDGVISHQQSLKLQKHLKPKDGLIILNGQGHNGMNYNEIYLETLAGKL